MTPPAAALPCACAWRLGPGEAGGRRWALVLVLHMILHPNANAQPSRTSRDAEVEPTGLWALGTRAGGRLDCLID